MICVSLIRPSIASCIEAFFKAEELFSSPQIAAMLEDLYQSRKDTSLAKLFTRGSPQPFLEIRLDKFKDQEEDLALLFSKEALFLATFRAGGSSSEIRKQRLIQALENGASLVDLDMSNSESMLSEMAAYCRKNRKSLILSIHDYQQTPEDNVIRDFISRAEAWAPDFIKLAARVNSEEEGRRLLNAASFSTKVPVMTVAMGEEALSWRTRALRQKTPFVYAALNSAEKAAPGQPSLQDFAKHWRKGYV